MSRSARGFCQGLCGAVRTSSKDRNKQRKVYFSADTLDWLAKYLEICRGGRDGPTATGLRGTVALALGGWG